MTPKPCHNCGATLREAEDGAVPRCAQCGTLQVRLSEDVQAEAERLRSADGAVPEREAERTHWRTIFLLAAGASAVAVPLCALVPSLSTVAWLLPAPVLLLYRARFSRGTLTPLAGARVGAVVGVFCSSGAAFVGTAYLLAMRFGLHRMAGFDAVFAGALAAAEKQASVQNGSEAAAQSALLATPEFRAGLLVLTLLTLGTVFILLCAVCGALAAAVQHRRPNQAG